MLVTWILFHPVWFLAICILDLSIYCKFESIKLFSFKKKILDGGFFLFFSWFFLFRIFHVNLICFSHSTSIRVIGVNLTSIFNVFSMCLCNLNVIFTPIFLKNTLIPHLLMFCKIKGKIKQGKGKKLRRKNLLFEALVHQGKGCFAAAKPKPNQRGPLGSPRQSHPSPR